ncbi:hypothetical protein [Streptomyces sp. NPDC004546]|uniref:hypothetical protein n=1 Tax=Streptomyces sp. NPDC004546 TaxID=3154282 RepID=UPI0033A6732B
MANFLRRRAAQRLLGDLHAAGYEDLDVDNVLQHFHVAMDWKLGKISLLELGARTRWGSKGDHTVNAARAFQDAKYELGAAMVQDYRAGKSEEEIVKQAAFTLPEADGRTLLHSSRLIHDALDALEPWMREPDGPIVIFPHGTRAATISAGWGDDEDEATRRRLLIGLDEALRAAGVGYRDRETKRPLNEEDLISDERTFPELYLLDAPDLVESVPI